MGGLKGALYATHPDNGETKVYPAGTARSDLPKWVKVDDGAFDDDSADGGYHSMRKADLEQEVANRNADRDEDNQVVVDGKGTVKDLIAALEADDANTGN